MKDNKAAEVKKDAEVKKETEAESGKKNQPKKISIKDYLYDGSRPFSIADSVTVSEPVYKNKKHYKKQLKDYRRKIGDRQNMMYADNRYSMLLVFQAMDAAGKDSTIYHTLSGVNPHGLLVKAFKRPSDNELDHDYLWRTNREMPQRGQLKVFNRSYYEEVLVVRVHPEILTGSQRIPASLTKNPETVWKQRYSDIRNMEQYQCRNGVPIIKFFLNVSKDEQRRRFIARIDEAAKNWKFEAGDVKERGYWDDYMRVYEQAINATASKHAPWYVIPADDKLSMRLIVAKIINNHMQALDITYPEVDPSRNDDLQAFKQQLLDE